MLIDFADAVIFPTAVVFVNIMQFKREMNKNQLEVVKAKNDFKVNKDDLSVYISQKKTKIDDLNVNNWTIVDREDYKIKKQIESIGVVLSKWDISFYRGITSGFNEAFYISEETKNEIIKEEPNSKEIIKPLLRGKDIKRWNYSFHDIFMINSHNGIRDKNIPRVDVQKDYPAIFKHLSKYYNSNSPNAILLPNGKYQTLVDRLDQGDNWTNLRNCAFIEEFEKEKIIWLEISDRANFCIDDKKHFLTNSAYFITGKNLKYLLSILNSRLIDFYHFKNTAQIAGGRKRYTKQYIELLPLPEIKTEQMQPFEIIADYFTFINEPNNQAIFEHASNDIINRFFEDVLNMMVYELYFEEHMKENKIDVLKFVDFEDINQLETFEEKRDVIQKEYHKLKEKDSPIRNRILLSSTRSPDIIKRINESTH